MSRWSPFFFLFYLNHPSALPQPGSIAAAYPLTCDMSGGTLLLLLPSSSSETSVETTTNRRRRHRCPLPGIRPTAEEGREEEAEEKSIVSRTIDCRCRCFLMKRYAHYGTLQRGKKRWRRQQASLARCTHFRPVVTRETQTPPAAMTKTHFFSQHRRCHSAGG